MPDGVQVRASPFAIALPQVKVAHVILVLILLLAVLTRFVGFGVHGRLDQPTDFYFDEVYFAKTGEEILHGDPRAWEFYGHENTHPPLSKLFMAGGMLFFGDNSFGWRFFGALAGVGSVLFMYLLARRLFDSDIAGLAAAFLLTCEGLALAQSRIATPDTFVLFFVLGCVYFLVTQRFLFAGVFFGAAVACKWIAALAGIPIVLYLLWLLIMRLREARSEGEVRWPEIALPSGLVSLYAGIALVIVGFLSRHPDQKPGLFDGLGVLDVAGWLLLITGILSIASALIVFVSEYREQRSFTFSPQGKLSLEIVVAFGVFFMLLPGFVYFLTYVPMLLNHPSTQAMGDVGWTGLGQVVRQNRMAYDFHQSLRSPHPYSSTWDSWPIMARPVYFYAGDHNAKIYALGNPAVFWASLPALAFALWQGLAIVRARLLPGRTLSVWGSLPQRNAALLFVVISYLALWLPMGLTSRVVFIYHYLPALGFAILALAFSVDSLWRREEPWGRYAAAGFLVLVFLTFAFFYPHLTAIPVANWLDKLYFPFDRGNLLDNDLFNWE
ncbi:MAG: phospholipid carrier-dependent glycosyltransferase [Chloroflexi bacterium]|nr:MAG: phospholipid carrier-dependent glycosyltransferase [Chloroflexota bacterium]